MLSYQQGSVSSDATPLRSNTSDENGSPPSREANGSRASTRGSGGGGVGGVVAGRPDRPDPEINSDGRGVVVGGGGGGGAPRSPRGSVGPKSAGPVDGGGGRGGGGGFPSRRRPKGKRTWPVAAAIAASILALVLCLKSLLFPSPFERPREDGIVDGGGDRAGPTGAAREDEPERTEGGLFDGRGRFVLEDYDARPAFSDFLPGVAGVYGKPVWSFYVNRGQCVASFGFESKDYPILEFYPANKAYQNAAVLGFRTFIAGRRGVRSFFAEPFSPTETRFRGVRDETGPSPMPPPLPRRVMYVGANEMQIRETDAANGIETNVTYFTLPEEDFGAFVRRTTITNTNTDGEDLTISMLDGLARMEPAGGKINSLLKDIGRTLEGWFGVYQAHEDVLTMPFYRMSTEASDTAAVKIQRGGHYILSFVEGGDSWLLPIVYDSSKVFGEDTTMQRPVGLQASSVKDILNGPQYGFAKTSSAFAAVEKHVLPPGKSVTIASFYGKAGDIMDVPVIARRVSALGFVQYKFTRAREIIDQITAGVRTETGHRPFDGHVQQMYLDNSLRGGIPIILGETDDGARMSSADEDGRLKVYHLFSRVHGDLERDYNDFVIEPTYFSQGPGNFRDVAQNRRNDVTFNPRIGAFNAKTFLSYIQADGYQPNSVEAVVFTIGDKKLCDDIATRVVGHADGVRAQREALSGILNVGPFRPGQVFLLMQEQNIELIVNKHEFVDMIASAAEASPMGVFTTGFWADHWTYYMDLIDNYLSIYPDMEESFMYNERLPYFFSPATVRPRSEKYVLSIKYGGKGRHVRQLEATNLEDERKERIRRKHLNNITGWFNPQANWQHDSGGNEFTSSPIAKLFVLATIKFATRDAYGMGIEYEAGKPGWNDAMNGLAGMIGSGLPETYELLVLMRYVRSVLLKYQRPVVLPAEVASLIDSINLALDDLQGSGYKDSPKLSSTVPAELFQYWDAVSSAREEYRDAIALSFSGDEHEISANEADLLLQTWIDQLETGLARSLLIGSHGHGDNGTSGITPTYFSFNVTKWKETGRKNEEGHPLVTPSAMVVGKFPLFLEGPVRMMKTVDEEEAFDIYSRVRSSGLRDGALSMYTISASLEGQSYDMGRMMAFTPGWLENQSVWLHMSYKFYLELIRHGLYKHFFEEMVSGGMLPFMNSDTYGRSLMECSSFIASSAFIDPSVRGRGFVARLSGSTAEFLSMWVLMFIGPRPFRIQPGTNELYMQLQPALPLWFFERDTDGVSKNGQLTVRFKLFSSIDVTYHNRARKDLFGVSPERYEVGLRDGSIIRIDGPTIPSEWAIKIRRVIFVDYIDAYF